MILTIFAFFVLFSLIIIGLGFWINNPVLEVLGFFFLFCLGLVLLSGVVSYQTGETYIYDNETIIQSNNVYSGFDADSSGEILGLFSLNHLFGVLISILGGFGMAITFFNMRVSK
jgi:hypothetical protein